MGGELHYNLTMVQCFTLHSNHRIMLPTALCSQNTTAVSESNENARYIENKYPDIIIDKLSVRSSPYTLIIPHRAFQLTTKA